MEKTIQITIASTVFSVTEEAYAKLNAYLETLKAHFVADSERTEIIRDIESRIAEKLLHKKQDVITEEDIIAVTAEIGDASEFGDTDDAKAPKQETRGERRLYRDTDNAIVGGVCAGLAAYFNIDPLIPRIIFGITLLGGGAGVFIYFLLWFLIPEAKTTGQKLEMRGSAVNLESIKTMVKDRVEEARERGVVRRLVEALGDVFRLIVRVFGKFIGIILGVATFTAIIGLTTSFGVILTNWNAPYNDFPLRQGVAEPLLMLGIFIGYIVILIPLVLVFALAVRFARGSTLLPSVVGFGLLGIWALFVIAGGVVGTKIAGEYYAFTETSPAYVTATSSPELVSFSRIEVHNAHANIKNGAQKVLIEGRERDLAMVTTEVKDGTLIISAGPRETHLCIFCDISMPSVTVSVPDVDSVNIQDGSVSFDDFSSDSLSVDARDGSVSGSLHSKALTLSAQDSSIRFDLTGETFMLSAKDSNLSLNGTMDSADFSLKDSLIDAQALMLVSAKLTSDDSTGAIYAKELQRVKDTDSHVVNVADESQD